MTTWSLSAPVNGRIYLSFWQENSASRAVEDLLAQVQVTVEVWRDGTRIFVPAHELVPGDVIVLNTGDIVPVDCLLVEARELLVDEAPLTSESYAVDNAPGVIRNAVIALDLSRRRAR